MSIRERLFVYVCLIASISLLVCVGWLCFFKYPSVAIIVLGIIFYSGTLLVFLANYYDSQMKITPKMVRVLKWVFIPFKVFFRILSVVSILFIFDTVLRLFANGFHETYTGEYFILIVASVFFYKYLEFEGEI